MPFLHQKQVITALFGACVALCPLASAQTVPDAAPLLAENQASQNMVSILLADYEAFRQRYDPSIAARAQDRMARAWTDITPAGRARELSEVEALLERTRALGAAHTLDTTILETILASQAYRMRLDPDRLPFTGDSGFHTEPSFVISRARIRNIQDAEDLVARIRAIPAYFDDNITNMRRGIATGYIAHKDPLATTLDQLTEMRAGDATESPLFQPFAQLPVEIEPGAAIRLRSDAVTAIEGAIKSYDKLYRFMREDYAQHAREKPGIGSLAGGREIYRAEVKYHTTRPDLTPEEIHIIGQAEVARIRAEMEDIIRDVGFEGSFAEFLTFLRTDPQFYAETPEELLSVAAVLSKKLDAALPRFFGKLPRLTYGVSPVPAEIAPGYTTGRYSGGDAQTGRAGTYLVNTYRLDQRPLYQMPALTAHEAVPGHHLQIALAQELENVPEFRRSYYATAFGEGWGLYAERIAGEAGLFTTPYERFGALSYEMWRACRLIADTGMHWYGWTREQGEACFRENSALAELNIKTEVTRYIGWPGQALGYKIGEITIRDLRKEAEATLGERFDLRAFHDLILAEGALPLTLLETRVEAWIAEQQDISSADLALTP